MEILLRFLLILTMLQIEVFGQNDAKNCRVFNYEDVNHYQCGEQFASKGYAYNLDRNASIVKVGEFPW